jgi:hypothetical protein
MVGLGYYFDSYLLAMSGLFVYALFKIREVILQAKYKPIVASIIRKYEAKLAELDSQAHSSQTTSASNAS